MSRPLPPANALTRAQYSGWACCWCGASLLRSGGSSVGVARGRSGAHVLDVEVYACPNCAPAPTISRPPHGLSHEMDGARPSAPRATIHNRRTT